MSLATALLNLSSLKKTHTKQEHSHDTCCLIARLNLDHKLMVGQESAGLFFAHSSNIVISYCQLYIISQYYSFELKVLYSGTLVLKCAQFV